ECRLACCGRQSIDVKVVSRDKLSGIGCFHLSQQIHVGQATPILNSVTLVIEDQQFRFSFRSQFSKLPGRRVVLRVVLLPSRPAVAILCVYLMNQTIAAVTGLRNSPARTGIPRNHYRAVRSLEAVTESLRPFSVWHLEGFDRDMAVSINDTGLDLVNVD